MFFIDRLGSYGLSVGSIGLVHFVSLMGGGGIVAGSWLII